LLIIILLNDHCANDTLKNGADDSIFFLGLLQEKTSNREKK
tara:strand:+ start:1102 stop:1224 length:123 start_codon:yes stop_codon:yes gene_type:complete